VLKDLTIAAVESQANGGCTDGNGVDKVSAVEKLEAQEVSAYLRVLRGAYSDELLAPAAARKKIRSRADLQGLTELYRFTREWVEKLRAEPGGDEHLVEQGILGVAGSPAAN